MTTVGAGNKITRLQAETSRLVGVQAEIGKDVFLMSVKGHALRDSVKTIMYGYLYNWFAVNRHVAESDDDYNLAPVGWRVASDADWTSLEDRIEAEHNQSPDDFGVANHLKSCRQVDSPLEGDCDTSEHPRWNSHGTHYGRDTVGFASVPGGERFDDGGFANHGSYCIWWSSSEDSYMHAWVRIIGDTLGDMFRFTMHKEGGYSIKCCRDVDEGENEHLLTDGDPCPTATDIDGNVYNTVKIGSLVWMVQNLATSRYRGGATIPKLEGNTAWGEDTDGARCAYDNDDNWVFHFKEWL